MDGSKEERKFLQLKYFKYQYWLLLFKQNQE